ncbi:hypothetical protein [Burkholderia territorii]|uniref:hypothetical protein n=1 Tax=Burkholderia territorii TaxID=1503055 RepID=UPI000B063009|nr:hypothetical protein [Burkholderia territorii]
MKQITIAALAALTLVLSGCGTTEPPPPECKGTPRAVNHLPVSRAALTCEENLA